MENRVTANLVVGADGSTTLAGSSAGLSSPADRARFHQLRGEFAAILIGGNTARNEPYQKTPSTLIVISHQSLPDRLRVNPQAQAWDMPLAAAIERATSIYGDLLLEGGPALILEAVSQGLVNELYLTISLLTPGEGQIDTSLLTKGATLIEEEVAEGAHFFHYRLAPSHL